MKRIFDKEEYLLHCRPKRNLVGFFSPSTGAKTQYEVYLYFKTLCRKESMIKAFIHAYFIQHSLLAVLSSPESQHAFDPFDLVSRSMKYFEVNTIHNDVSNRGGLSMVKSENITISDLTHHFVSELLYQGIWKVDELFLEPKYARIEFFDIN
jgi:hypothetical protein